MQRVNKQEMEWLIEKGFLKKVRGNLIDIIVTNRGRKKAHKNRYVPDKVAFHLNKMKDYK